MTVEQLGEGKRIMEKWILVIVRTTAFIIAMYDVSSDVANNDHPFDLNAANGEQLYETNCAACHAGDLTGGADLDLTTIATVYSIDDIELDH